MATMARVPMYEKKNWGKEEGKNIRKKRGQKNFWWWTARVIWCGVEGMGVLT